MNNYTIYFIFSVLFILITGTATADHGDLVVVEPITPIHIAPGENFSFGITLNNTGIRPATSTIKFDEVPDCINKSDNYYKPKTISREQLAMFNVRFKVDDDAKEGEYVLKVSDSTGSIGDQDTWTDILILVSKNETKVVPTSIQTLTPTPTHTVIQHQFYTETIDDYDDKTVSVSKRLIIIFIILLCLFFVRAVIKKIRDMLTPPPSDNGGLVVHPPIQMETPQGVSGADAIADIPIQTTETSQIPMVGVITVHNINDVIEDAECPYCHRKIRDTFDEGIVKCTACDTPHHKECFDYYKRCGSKQCKLRKT